MYIHSLSLENIKAFSTLELDFSRPAENKYAGLNFFVGGNSAGKSTLLKCMAMAVSGPTVANQQIISPDGWVRRGSEKGTIETRLYWESGRDTFRSKGSLPLQGNTISTGLVFEPGTPGAGTLKQKRYTTANRSKVLSAERGPWNPDSEGWFLSGYGPLRRLTGSSTDALRYALGKGKLASCVTLFREDAALSESETWLKQEHARALERQSQNKSPSGLVDNVRDFLNDGLMPNGFKITQISVDHVYMTTPNGGDLPLRDLSDGCRSTYALMLDIIHSMASTYGAGDLFSHDANGHMVVNHPGVVLIDELEAHLHPAWQRMICEWLKTRFPKIQFFITTHSPLIVQAADPGGIFVLPLPHEMSAGRDVRRLTNEEQAKIVFGRAEKVLLGEAFGLRRTWGVRADAMVHRWEKLSALRQEAGQLAAPAQAEYVKLSQQMALLLDNNESASAGNKGEPSGA